MRRAIQRALWRRSPSIDGPHGRRPAAAIRPRVLSGFSVQFESHAWVRGPHTSQLHDRKAVGNPLGHTLCGTNRRHICGCDIGIAHLSALAMISRAVGGHAHFRSGACDRWFDGTHDVSARARCVPNSWPDVGWTTTVHGASSSGVARVVIRPRLVRVPSSAR